jgi:FecR protein
VSNFGHYVQVSMVTKFLALALTLSSGLQAQGESAQPAVQITPVAMIGKVVKITGSATIEHTEAVVLQANLEARSDGARVGDSVYTGDVVETGVDGRIGISFVDGTAFNMATGARMVLNEFVYDPNGKSNSTLINLVRGAFTFVAGKIAKTGNMKVDTPVASIAIRGTTPRIEIANDGSIRFFTLVEEEPERGTRVRPRQGSIGPSQVPQPSPTPSKRAGPNINLNICRGC